MSANYQYIVERGLELCRAGTAPPRLLDYGCGAGEIVKIALESGFDAHGVDLYYGGGKSEAKAMETGLWGERIHRFGQDGVIPMADESFDVVTANQVFEHIADFSTPLREIARVMKRQGVFINIFPSGMVWREGHNGIPFVHWFSKDSRPRYLYAYTLRSAGLGFHKEGKTIPEWVQHKLSWLDTWVFYKPLAVILREFERSFTVERYEADYLAYRIERHRVLKYTRLSARSPMFEPIMRAIAARLAGHVFVLRKRARAESR